VHESGYFESQEVSASASSKDVHHVLIRVRSDEGQTILAHDAILRAKGTALLGKMGKPIGDKYIDLLKQAGR